MKDAAYQFIVGALDLFLWGGELVGEENLPRRGPAVFIANHLESTGPVAAACSIPLRIYPWIIGDMLDKERAPEYMQWDFVERTLHLKPPVSRWVAGAICRISVPLLRSIGCVPVYKGEYERMIETLRLSMNILRDGKFLLVFPEDNLMEADPVTRMKPFQRSFARLGEMYFQETGERLEFFPVTIHSSGYVEVGKAVAFNPFNPAGLERHRLKDLLESSVRTMYLQLEHGEHTGMLTPVRK